MGDSCGAGGADEWAGAATPLFVGTGRGATGDCAEGSVCIATAGGGTACGPGACGICIGEVVTCPGGGYFYGRWFQCHLKRGHGSVDLRHAIEQSCNVYFYTLGTMLKIDQIHKWATRLGLGVRSGIDLPHEVEGIVPSTEWKRSRYNERWYPGETISVAIGQGQLSVTPVSMALMMATVANGGTLHKPQLLKAVDEGQGWKPVAPEPWWTASRSMTTTTGA